MRYINLKLFSIIQLLVALTWLVLPIFLQADLSVALWLIMLSGILFICLLFSKATNFLIELLPIRTTLFVLFIVYIFANFVPYFLGYIKDFEILASFVLPSIFGLTIFLFTSFEVDNS